MSPTDVVTPFKKSSYSSQGGECVETARTADNGQAVRDSKDPHGPTLAFPSTAWSAFVTALKTSRLPRAEIRQNRKSGRQYALSLDPRAPPRVALPAVTCHGDQGGE